MSNDVERALSALYALDPGIGRTGWLQIGFAAQSAGVSLEQFTEWSRQAPNFGSDKECAAVWKAFKPGRVTAGTLFWLARQAGWIDPGRRAR